MKVSIQKKQTQKNWLCISIYRPPEMNKLDSFFDELNTTLYKACCKSENFDIMEDFKIDVKLKGNSYQKLDEFCDLFNITNLADTETCVTDSHNKFG